MRLLVALVAVAIAGWSTAAVAQQPAEALTMDYNREIRPILTENCFPCHGPDANRRQAELRFDLRNPIFADRGGYAAITPGSPDESEAIRRVLSTDEYEQMPPPGSKQVLTEEQKQRLVEWVRKGASWSPHWSFVKPEVRPLPKVERADWPANEIDHFTLAAMEARQLQPSARAGREALIRRVTLDLSGLPPTPEEVDRFLADESKDAFERVVDRLLASSRYGERMAWPWLVAARYADTDGFQGDPTRDMWPWRDWLVQALNDNMPFDQFTVEMLAGDQLPDASVNQVLASAFNRNHMYNGEGGRIPEETRTENVFDRTETMATVWMGLTATCARCHDHKFDPLSHQEYYQLFAFFNQTSEDGQGAGGKARPLLPYLAPEQQQAVSRLDKRITILRERMNAADPKLDASQAAWLAEVQDALRRVNDESPLAETEFPTWQAVGTIPAPDGEPQKTFGHDYGPEANFDLAQTFGEGEIQLSWQVRPDFEDGKVNRLLDTTGATYLYREFDIHGERTFNFSFGSDDGIKVWINGKLLVQTDTQRVAQPDQESLEITLPPGKNQVLIKIINTGGAAGFYFQKTKESIHGLPLALAKQLIADDLTEGDETSRAIRDAFRQENSADWRKAKSELDRLAAKRKELGENAARVMVMDSLPSEKRRATHILERGNYEKPQGEVTAGAPSFLPTMPPDARRDRVALARWLVSPEHPLTARVTVNRYWQLFFGAGLVTTPEDFGRQGEPPSHPELLDWLATRFIQSGWDVKALHKLIVMSETYRQSSAAPGGEASYALDPKNRYLSRGPRYRLPSWMLRDQALAASGLLVDQQGGPGVSSYQPDGIWAEATFGAIKFRQGSGDDLYRRSLYSFWRRIVGPTIFFDESKRQTCEVSQARTNSPLHALTTLNETTFVECSRKLAERAMREVPGGDEAEEEQAAGEQGASEHAANIVAADSTVSARIARAFRLLTAREPNAQESQVLTARWHKLYEHFSADAAAANELLSVGESPRDESLDPAEHAAYAAVCSIIMNLDEVLSKE